MLFFIVFLALFCHSTRSYPVLLFVLTSLTFNHSKPSAWKLRLINSSSLNVACLCTTGTQNTELIRCLPCHRMEFDWRIHYEDDYTCSKCEDLQRFEFNRNSFFTLYHHLKGILPLPLSLPHLFDYLYPTKLRHKHTHIQRKPPYNFSYWAPPTRIITSTTYTHTITRANEEGTPVEGQALLPKELERPD